MRRTQLAAVPLLAGLLYLSTALAQSVPSTVQDASEAVDGNDEIGDFRIRVGPNATVKRLPRANGSIVEMYARGIDPEVNLRSLFRGNTEKIAALDAVERPGGVWLLRASLRDSPDNSPLDIEVRIEGSDLVLDVVPGTPPQFAGREQAPTLAQLLSGELPEVSAEPSPASVFRLLPGDAISQRMEPWQYQNSITRRPKNVYEPSWEKVDENRRRMLRAQPGTPLHQEYMYYLGHYYLEMGFGREARYYFSQMSARPGAISQADIALERARAELACGNYDIARQWFSESHALGADHNSILEGLAVISLATGNPSRAGTGRLIWATTSASGPLLLAAELLQIDGRMAESRMLLDLIDPSDLSPEDQQRRALRLGDARFYSRVENNIQQAALAWDAASPEMARSRDLFLELHQAGADPQKWTQQIPSLVQASMHRSDAGAEALYLLFQIDAAVGSREDAINDLALILRRYPQKSKGSDVPERFWRVYSSYVADLAKAEQYFDIAALHESVWSPTVKRAVRSPQALVQVANAYQEVGLPLRAVNVLRDATQVLLDSGSDDNELVYKLAELYAAVGESAGRLPASSVQTEEAGEGGERVFGSAQDEVWQSGLDTVKYLRDRNEGSIPLARIDLLEARLHLGREDIPAAVGALRKASRSPDYRDEALLRLALIDASQGRCVQALPSLRRLAGTETVARYFEDTQPWLALARCEMAAGNSSRGAAAAREAAQLAQSKLDALKGSEALTASTEQEQPGEEALEIPADVRGPTPTPEEEGEGASPDASDKCGLANRRECYSKVQEQLRQILEDELKYSLGLAAIADGWQDREVVKQLKERGGVWSAMAADFDDDQDFQSEVDLRGTIPWEGQ